MRQTIQQNEQFAVTSKGRSESITDPSKIGSKLIVAIKDGEDTLGKLTDHFQTGGLAPRSEEAVDGRVGTEKYIRGYLTWMIRNGWISRKILKDSHLRLGSS